MHNSRSLLTQATPLKGIQERSQIGFLYWDKGENDDSRTEVWAPTLYSHLNRTKHLYHIHVQTNVIILKNFTSEFRLHLLLSKKLFKYLVLK